MNSFGVAQFTQCLMTKLFSVWPKFNVISKITVINLVGSVAYCYLLIKTLSHCSNPKENISAIIVQHLSQAKLSLQFWYPRNVYKLKVVRPTPSDHVRPNDGKSCLDVVSVRIWSGAYWHTWVYGNEFEAESVYKVIECRKYK